MEDITTPAPLPDRGIFDDNPFSDPETLEDYDSVVSLNLMIAYYAIFEIIKIILYLCTIVSCIFIIVIIARFKKLHTRVNGFILLYAIFNILYLLIANLIIIVVELNSHSMFQYCLMSNFDHLSVTLCFYTLTWMVLDWYCSIYHPEFHGKYPRTFRYGIGVAFLAFALPKWATKTVMCFQMPGKVYLIGFGFEAVSFTICVIVLVGISCLRRLQKPVKEVEKSEYAFLVAKTAFLMSFPAYILRVVEILGNDHDYTKITVTVYIIHFFEYLAEYLFLSQAMVILVVLGRVNKYFKIAFLKCCKKNREYADEDLDSDSEECDNVTFLNQGQISA